MDRSDKDMVYGCLSVSLMIPGFIIFAISAILWEGYVFMRMWNWFVFDYISNQEITLAVSVGLCTLFSLLTARYSFTTKQEKEHGLENLIGSMLFRFVMPAFVLLIGYVTHTYFM